MASTSRLASACRAGIPLKGLPGFGSAYIAEATLRRVALGRANFLFVGNEDSGHDLAVLTRPSVARDGLLSIGVLLGSRRRAGRNRSCRASLVAPYPDFGEMQVLIGSVDLDPDISPFHWQRHA